MLRRKKYKSLILYKLDKISKLDNSCDNNNIREIDKIDNAKKT